MRFFFIHSIKNFYQISENFIWIIFCSIHFYCNFLTEMIMSAILLKYLKTHWVSGRNLSGILLKSLSSRTLSNTLPTTERKDILQSSQEPPSAHFSNLLEHALLSKPFVLSQKLNQIFIFIFQDALYAKQLNTIQFLYFLKERSFCQMFFSETA